MKFNIRMGLPEMEALWSRLQKEHRAGTISKMDASLYKKLGKTLKLLAENPRHPGLQTHDIPELTNRYGERVWQSYLENKTSGAMRIYWVFHEMSWNCSHELSLTCSVLRHECHMG